ncbi:MAG: molybdopterin-dependent oxidoreductase [Candidatus Rokubacteria bacterium]|nr:molybdopterin-dependent oxidoreductase [Candidatus Rokubacteria bacterium]
MIQFTLNGRPVHTTGDPATPLIAVLRDEMRLTGTKLGCDDGRCGACTVLVNGRVARACLTAAGKVRGAAVLTVEGLGSPEHPHALQRAFVETGAVQCGFCIPGMIMASKALLETSPRPRRDQIVKALGANLCRCAGYPSVFEAVERAAAVLRGDAVPQPPLPLAESWEEMAKATGKARYGADLFREGMLHLKIVRSPHAHARIREVDTAEALAIPGVEAVLTAKDVPFNHHGRAIQDQNVLAGDRVRMIGDPVAAVVATSEGVAAEAAARVRVRYELLPAVLSPREALEPGAPRVHDGGNVLSRQAIQRGDADAALTRADVTVNGTFATPFIEHAYLEPEAALGWVDDEGRVVIETGTAHPHLHRLEVSRALGLPADRVRVVAVALGGHFGGRVDVAMHCILGVAASRLRRPVRSVYTREESFTSTTKRHAFDIRGRLGADRDGRITGLRLDMTADTGAYASAGTFIITRAAVSGSGPYEIPDVWLGGHAVYTNNTLAGAMRGFGAPQSAFALESLMDDLAKRLDIHPIELRLRNALRPGGMLPTGFRVGDGTAVAETLEAVRPRYDEALRRARESRGNGELRCGVGVASMWFGIGSTGGEKPSHADVELLPSGRVVVLAGASDAGQGSDYVLRRVAAQVLGVPLPHVDLVRGDTALTRDTGSCSGSRVSFYVGNAVRIASGALRRAIIEAAAWELEAPRDILEIRDGHVIVLEAPGRRIALADLARRVQARGARLREGGTYDPETCPLDPATGIGRPYATYASATHMAEVEVNVRTGLVRVRRVVAAHDVGKVLNPAGARGQVEGAVIMGVGFALAEEFVPGVTRGFAGYRIPTTRDVPAIETIFVERPDPAGPFGGKGLGECALVPAAPAILNAIADATGARITRLPATPARVLEALRVTPRISAGGR